MLQKSHPLGIHAQTEHLPEAQTGHATEELLEQGVAGGVTRIEDRLLELKRP